MDSITRRRGVRGFSRDLGRLFFGPVLRGCPGVPCSIAAVDNLSLRVSSHATPALAIRRPLGADS